MLNIRSILSHDIHKTRHIQSQMMYARRRDFSTSGICFVEKYPTGGTEQDNALGWRGHQESKYQILWTYCIPERKVVWARLNRAAYQAYHKVHPHTTRRRCTPHPQVYQKASSLNANKFGLGSCWGDTIPNCSAGNLVVLRLMTSDWMSNICQGQTMCVHSGVVVSALMIRWLVKRVAPGESRSGYISRDLTAWYLHLSLVSYMSYFGPAEPNAPERTYVEKKLTVKRALRGGTY